MQIAVFEVENWERAAVQRILETTIDNIQSFAEGNPKNNVDLQKQG